MANTTVTPENWMSGLDDATLVRDMSIPGSHESCALYGGGLSQCQSLTITQQLNRGIRFFDIRCVNAYGGPAFERPDDFPIYHGGLTQGIWFSAVQEQCAAFLDRHPTETILMNVQLAQPGNLRNRPDSEFQPKFSKAIAPYAGHWSFPDWSPPSSPWPLGRCRNQIILIRSGWPSTGLPGGNGLEWNGYAVNGMSYNALFQTQNHWEDAAGNPQSTPNKIREVEHYLELAAAGVTGRNRIYLNFLSWAAGAYVGTAAEAVNNQVLPYVASGMTAKRGRLGVVALDFVGNTGWNGCLEEAVIRRNPFVPGCSFTYPLSPFRLQLKEPGQPWQGWWMFEGEQGWAVVGEESTPGHPNADDPLVFERDGDLFTVKNDGRYLNTSYGGQVGLYRNSGTVFRDEGGQLVSEYMGGKPMRVKSNGELWCGDDGDVLEVVVVQG